MAHCWGVLRPFVGTFRGIFKAFYGAFSGYLGAFVGHLETAMSHNFNNCFYFILSFSLIFSSSHRSVLRAARVRGLILIRTSHDVAEHFRLFGATIDFFYL